MRAIRLELFQREAHYRKEETMDNKMTYPLPPPSTVIGALHAACGYQSYHPMDISIQGEYRALRKEPYVDHCFLNSIMDDRGILVKMASPHALSAGFTKVAAAKKSQGNSFRNNITIEVFNEALLKEYQALRDHKDFLDEWKKGQKDVISHLNGEVKTLQQQVKVTSDATELDELKAKIEDLKKQAKELTQAMKEREEKEYTIPISYYQSLTTSLKYYELLHDVHLVLHIAAEEDVLQDIMENICNLQALGRSEDFVEVLSCTWVDLTPITEDLEEETYTGKLPMYVRRDLVVDYALSTYPWQSHTKYYLNKKYEIAPKTGQRIFTKVPAVYIDRPTLEVDNAEDKLGLWLEWQNGEAYPVCFL